MEVNSERPRRRSWLLAAALLLMGSAETGRGAALAELLVNTSFQGRAYTTCEIDPTRQDLRLYWDDAHGIPLRNFTALEKQVNAQGEKLLFAANAGMFEPNDKPVGLLVKNEVEQFPLNLGGGYGNFYAKPNGVFVIDSGRHAKVIESSWYSRLAPAAVWATQSGPLLVQEGNINSHFLETSQNRKIRSGVGVTSSGKIVFALSRSPITFYEFARLFLVRLKCPDALFLDGEISAFHTAGMAENEGQHNFGPMFGLVETLP